MRRLGIPDIRGQRSFVAAVAVDAVGTGLFIPVSLLYFIATTDLSVEQVGLTSSIGALIALPAVLGVGHLVDRIGAKPVLLAANVLMAAGFVGFLFAMSFWSVTVLMAVVGVGGAAFWASEAPLVASISQRGERELWFGFLGALRNIGFALGGLVGGLAVTIGTAWAYHAIVIVNTASFVGSLLLLLRVPAPAPSKHSDEVAPSWSIALRDTEYRWLIASNVVYALSSLTLNVALPIYAKEVLHLPGWVVGAIFTVNTVLVGFGQGLAVRWMTGRVRYRLAVLSNLAFALGYVLFAGLDVLSIGMASVVIIAVTAVYTIGELVGGPVLTTIAVDSRPDTVRGRYVAAYQLSWMGANIVAPAAYTWLLSRSSTALWVALIGMSAVGAAINIGMRSRLSLAAANVTNAAEAPHGDDAHDENTVPPGALAPVAQADTSC